VPIQGLHFSKNMLTIYAHAMGPSKIVLKMPQPGSVNVAVHKSKKIITNFKRITGEDGILALELPALNGLLEVKIETD
jgi:hypothetical protein